MILPTNNNYYDVKGFGSDTLRGDRTLYNSSLIPMPSLVTRPILAFQCCTLKSKDGPGYKATHTLTPIPSISLSASNIESLGKGPSTMLINRTGILG